MSRPIGCGSSAATSSCASHRRPARDNRDCIALRPIRRAPAIDGRERQHQWTEKSGEEETQLEAPSHVVFGLAGAVVIDSAVHHFTGPALLGGPAPTADTVAIKVIYYAFAALGAISPDIDNARSTIGKRAGFVSKGIQHLAGHRTLFHSILGMGLVGMFIWPTSMLRSG